MSLAGLQTDTKRTCRCEMDLLVSEVLRHAFATGDGYGLKDRPYGSGTRREKARELLEELFTIPECGRCKS